MLLRSLGPNAEYVGRLLVNPAIVQIGPSDSRRVSGLIVNYSSGNIFIEFGDYPHRLINDPTFTLKIPANGGNMDIPTNYTGSIWCRWANVHALGYLNIHHYINLPNHDCHHTQNTSISRNISR